MLQRCKVEMLKNQLYNISTFKLYNKYEPFR